VSSPMVQATHAVTINAPPQQVWPWLVQTGQGRAGFYSDSPFWDRSVDWYYRRLSRGQPGKESVGYHVGTDERIVAAWQNPRVGDIIADGPPGTAYYVVRQAEPGKSWVLFTDTHLRYLLPARLRDNLRLGIFGELSDSTVLTEPEPGTTRVIRRMRLSCGPWPFRPTSSRSSWSGARPSPPGTCCAGSRDGPRQALPDLPAKTLDRGAARSVLWARTCTLIVLGGCWGVGGQGAGRR
jgi:hypothetical protein